MTLENELKPEHSSEYLTEGFAKDRMRIYDLVIDLDGDTVSGKMDLLEFYEPRYAAHPDLGFHLSALTAYRFVNQLIIAYACKRLEKTKAELGEFFEISHQMREVHSVTNPRDISATVRCAKYLPRGDKIFGEFEFTIQDNSINGSVRGRVMKPKV